LAVTLDTYSHARPAAGRRRGGQPDRGSARGNRV